MQSLLRRLHCRRSIQLSVADTGSGIPPAVRARLFESFFSTEEAVGNGLGSWVYRSIIDNHQESIQVRSSTAPGRSGTVFSVFLPWLRSNLSHPPKC